ncbi:MAG TPA: maleylpyruvate isomerase family mycothiol-dependent enzyme [Streptosporangiaceae bacterium]|nr:maleylpyruvate isomerase family mycothiol-dependent enzyme [Streptosporangiaceae bacterium]
MEITEYIDALRRQGDLLANAAERSGLDASVPTCPPWHVKDLLRHTGYVHRWAARHITECPDTVLDGPPEADILRGGAADPDLLAWFRAGHAALVETLSTADPGLVCATFMDAPSPLAFWARRQAHETAIHRADADSASGIRPEYEPGFAADGIDELIMGFGQRRRYRPSAGHDGGMQLRTTDTGDAWQVAAEDGRIQARRERDGSGSGASAACTVTGPASGIYLFLWNRSDAARAGVTISGDTGFLESWQSSVRVRWG